MRIDAIRSAFGNRPFTASEALVALGPGAKMALSRLLLAGRLERVRRGVYRVAAPETKDRIDAARADLRRMDALRAPFRIALDGPDAVSAWTGGRYTVKSAPPGEETMWLAVATPDLEGCAAWLEARGWKVGSEWPQGRGPKAIVRAMARLKPKRLDGVPVIPRAEVLRLIKSQPSAYEGAQEWLLAA